MNNNNSIKLLQRGVHLAMVAMLFPALGMAFGGVQEVECRQYGDLVDQTNREDGSKGAYGDMRGGVCRIVILVDDEPDMQFNMTDSDFQELMLAEEELELQNQQRYGSEVQHEALYTLDAGYDSGETLWPDDGAYPDGEGRSYLVAEEYEQHENFQDSSVDSKVVKSPGGNEQKQDQQRSSDTHHSSGSSGSYHNNPGSHSTDSGRIHAGAGGGGDDRRPHFPSLSQLLDSYGEASLFGQILIHIKKLNTHVKLGLRSKEDPRNRSLIEFITHYWYYLNYWERQQATFTEEFHNIRDLLDYG